jgi:protein-S-isoprenylcysteine O-methyltransferase Ste14
VTTEAVAVSAVILYAGGLALLLGVRSRRHRRLTGASGFAGVREARSGWAWVAGLSFAGALIIGVVTPLLVVLGALSVIGAAVVWVLAVAGLVVAVAGSVGAWRAQSAMGSSWRIGVDDTEETALVTDGIFGTVRNPIFTAMIIAQAGTVVMVPTWLGLVGVGLLVVACQLQVRLVEEPYLSTHHGLDYDRYAVRTGRFLPGIGRKQRHPNPTADIGGA